MLVCSLLAGSASAVETKVNWYGYFKLDMAYDSAFSSHGNFTMWVKPHGEDNAIATLNTTARQTRIGLNLEREEMKGKLEFDFYGGGAENKNLLQLRKVYVDLPLGSVSLRAGQDSDLMSPLVPSTINYTVCWGIGNIGYRRPQLRIYQQQKSLYWGIALARNISPDLNGDTIADGDAGTPVLQGRLAYTLKPGDMKLTLGGSGHYGIMDSPGAAKDSYDSWSINGEARLVVNPRVEILGEFYSGSNMATYFGSILNGDSVGGLNSQGGWANLQYKVTEELSISLGGSVDSVDEEDLGTLSEELSSMDEARLTELRGVRSSNRVVFGNVQYVIGSGVKAGVEISRWITKYPNAAADVENKPTALRLQFAVTGSF